MPVQKYTTKVQKKNWTAKTKILHSNFRMLKKYAGRSDGRESIRSREMDEADHERHDWTTQ